MSDAEASKSSFSSHVDNVLALLVLTVYNLSNRMSEPKGMYQLGWRDAGKGAITALLAGIIVSLAAAFQLPDFGVFSADWLAIMDEAVNGGVAAFIAYILKNFFSDRQGKVLGRV